MAKEIEYKFLVIDNSYKKMSRTKHEISQGYLSTDVNATVRVRVKDDKAYLTVKGKNSGCMRDEWEYAIPVGDALEMLERLAQGSVIKKTRYIVPFEGHDWEVDEFHSPAAGLVIAEIELESADEVFSKPPFVGENVTGNPAYYNSAISSQKKSSSH
jgi:adenylate cyclase